MFVCICETVSRTVLLFDVVFCCGVCELCVCVCVSVSSSVLCLLFTDSGSVVWVCECVPAVLCCGVCRSGDLCVELNRIE